MTQFCYLRVCLCIATVSCRWQGWTWFETFLLPSHVCKNHQEVRTTLQVMILAQN